jgi:hypothetical protein
MSLFKKSKVKEENAEAGKPVCIFMTDKTYEAEIVRGLLESSGIEAFIITSGREKDLMLPITKLFEQEPEKHYKIYVKENDEADAKKLLNGAENIE